MATVQIKSMRAHHEHIIDWLLSHPQAKNRSKLAEQLNVTEAWLSVVINSDAFQVEYQKRRDEYNIKLADNVQTRLYEVAHKSLMRLDEALDSDELDPSFILNAADKMTSRMGFSPSKGDAPSVSVVVNSVDRTMLQEARELMGRRKEEKEAIDGEALPAPSPA